MSKENLKKCKEGCLEHKYHCAKCGTAVTYSPANYASRPEDIPNPCEFCFHTPTKNELKDWEEEFDEKFIVLNSGQIILREQLKEGVVSPKDNIETIKSFIRQTHTSLISEAVERLEGMERELPKQPCMNAENRMFGSCFSCEKIKGFNDAISEAVSILKELTKK